MVKHSLPSPQGSNVGALELHAQVGGVVVILQVSELDGQPEAS